MNNQHILRIIIGNQECARHIITAFSHSAVGSNGARLALAAVLEADGDPNLYRHRNIHHPQIISIRNIFEGGNLKDARNKQLFSYEKKINTLVFCTETTYHLAQRVGTVAEAIGRSLEYIELDVKKRPDLSEMRDLRDNKILRGRSILMGMRLDMTKYQTSADGLFDFSNDISLCAGYVDHLVLDIGDSMRPIPPSALMPYLHSIESKMKKDVLSVGISFSKEDTLLMYRDAIRQYSLDIHIDNKKDALHSSVTKEFITAADLVYS